MNANQLRRGSIAPLLRHGVFLVATLALTANVFATFYRGSSASYSIAGNGIVTVDVFSVWRSDFAPLPNFQVRTGPNGTGTLLGNMAFASSQSPYAFGTENINPLTGALITPPPSFTVRRDQFVFNLAGRASGTYYARWASCCRVAGIRNVPANDWSLELKIIYKAGKASSGPTMIPLSIDVIGRGYDYIQNLNSTDPDGTPLLYELVTGSGAPNFGPDFNIPGLSLNASGTLAISGANTANLQPGRWVYKARVTDGEGGTAERDAVVLVQDPFGNTPPQLEKIDAKTVAAGSPLAFSVRGSDPSGQKLTIRSLKLPMGAQFPPQSANGNVTGNFSWTPQPGQEGIYSVNFELLDEASSPMVSSELVQITVTGPNTPPVLNSVGNQVIANGETLTLQLSGNDADAGQALSYEAFHLPAGATFDTATATFSWTPSSAQSDNTFHGISFRARDDGAPSLTDTETITITVGAGNVPPSIDAVSPVNAVRGTPLEVTITARDANPGQQILLSALASTLPAGATFTSGTGNSVVQGTLSWTPTASQVGTHTVWFRVEDNANPVLTADRAVTINVAQNTPPAADDKSISLPEDSSAQVTLTGSDADGDILTFIIVAGPAHGTLSGDGAARVYIPAANYNGPDSFTFKVNDGLVDSAVAAVSINVTPVNDPPVVQNPVPDLVGDYGQALELMIAPSTFADLESGNALGLSVAGLPPGVSFDPSTATFSGIPAAAGIYNVSLIATDTGDNGTPPLSVSDQIQFTVRKAPLLIRAENKQKVYGAELPEFTASFQGFVNGDSTGSLIDPAVFSTTAAASSPVGNYPIVPQGASSPNYLISFEEGVLSVTPAPLVVRAENKTKVYGANLPALTASYDGLVNGDTAAAVAPVNFTTALDHATDAGVYENALTVSATPNPNYIIELKPGTLTVTKAPLVATANASRQYGSANPAFTIVYSGFVLEQGPEVLDLAPAASATATVESFVGDYPITLAGGSDNNYELQFATGTLTITPAPLTATITAPEAGFLAPLYQNIDFTGAFTKSGEPARTGGLVGPAFYLGIWDLQSAGLNAFENATLEDLNVLEGSVADSFHFETPGVYQVRLLISDAAENVATAATVNDHPAFVVIYDSTADYIAGGGWINSPAGAIPGAEDSANGYFGFVSQYVKGAKKPSGVTEFFFKTTGLLFQSSSYDRLAVAGSRAQFDGSGRVNGEAGFGFTLTIVDGQASGGGGSDRFRMKIWNQATGQIVYDNQMNAKENGPLSDSATISSGSIMINTTVAPSTAPGRKK